MHAEEERNDAGHKTYERLLRLAFGAELPVVVGHHVSFTMADGHLNEIPSADTAIFDHVIMERAFGGDRFTVMAELAVVAVPARDTLLLKFVEGEERRRVASQAVQKLTPAEGYAG